MGGVQGGMLGMRRKSGEGRVRGRGRVGRRGGRRGIMRNMKMKLMKKFKLLTKFSSSSE